MPSIVIGIALLALIALIVAGMVIFLRPTRDKAVKAAHDKMDEVTQLNSDFTKENDTVKQREIEKILRVKFKEMLVLFEKCEKYVNENFYKNKSYKSLAELMDAEVNNFDETGLDKNKEKNYKLDLTKKLTIKFTRKDKEIAESTTLRDKLVKSFNESVEAYNTAITNDKSTDAEKMAMKNNFKVIVDALNEYKIFSNATIQAIEKAQAIIDAAIVVTPAVEAKAEVKDAADNVIQEKVAARAESIAFNKLSANDETTLMNCFTDVITQTLFVDAQEKPAPKTAFNESNATLLKKISLMQLDQS